MVQLVLLGEMVQMANRVERVMLVTQVTKAKQ